MVKYLIICKKSVKDLILASAMFRCLKEQVEGAELFILTHEEHEHAVKYNPNIKATYVFNDNSSFKKLQEQLRETMFDYIIDLDNDGQSRKLTKKLKIVSFRHEHHTWKYWRYIHFLKKNIPGSHLSERFFETLKVFDVKNDKKGVEYFIDMYDELNLLSLPGNLPFGFIAFVISAPFFTRKILTEKIINICNNIEHPVLLIGYQTDEKIGDEIVRKTHCNVHNVCGKYNFNQNASLIRQSRLIITADNDFMHVAASFKKTIISIWGNTIPAFGEFPYTEKDKSFIAQVQNLKCRPCSQKGFDKCPEKHFKCMQEIENDKIAELANLLTVTLSNN